MKVIDTEFRSQEAISWEDLENFLSEGIYEEGFIVLGDDTHPDYVQMGEMESDKGWQWGVEVRLYGADNISFQHFRRFFDKPEDATFVFKAIYHNKALDFEKPHWEDITDTF